MMGGPMRGRGGMMMMGPRGGHGFHPYGPPRGAMMGGQRGAFSSYPAMMPPTQGPKHPVSLLHEKLGVRLLGYSQGRQVIRKRPKGFAQSMHWQSCMRNPKIRRKHSCERGFDISEKLISVYMDMISKHVLVILFLVNCSLQL